MWGRQRGRSACAAPRTSGTTAGFGITTYTTRFNKPSQRSAVSAVGVGSRPLGVCWVMSLGEMLIIKYTTTPACSLSCRVSRTTYHAGAGGITRLASPTSTRPCDKGQGRAPRPCAALLAICAARLAMRPPPARPRPLPLPRGPLPRLRLRLRLRLPLWRSAPPAQPARSAP
jgi:hypothetical protein